MRKIAPYNAKQVEESVLEFWKTEDIFARSLEKTKAGETYSFYDGPPFANGLPHFGHSLVTSIKDSIGRYQTMRGRYVPRRNGWDCHGVPVEFEIEKKFGVSGKQQITELGIEKFNSACRESVFTYKTDWEAMFERIGRWSDTENSYATMDRSFTESVWWVFAQVHKKGLLYKGFKSMPYCPRCATPLSNFEVNEGYKDNVSDPSVFVKFKLTDEDASLLAWTTTPWSLPGNAALAVKPGALYVKLRVTDDAGETETLILAKDRIEALQADNYEVLEEMSGQDLVGKSYQPVFALTKLEPNPDLYKVWPAEFVSIEDGTGVLHVAPAFGEDDLSLGQEHDLPVLQTVDSEGKIKSGLGLEGFEGKFFKGADKLIIEQLSQEGKIYAAETFEHTYPFCYRCDTPLLYYAIDTWFLAVSQIKDQLQKSADQIEWVPSNIKAGRFGKWLEGARDWAISRNRYWGAAVPIWVNEQDESDFIVIESIEQLQKLAKGQPNLEDLHRPYIDDVVIEQDGKTYRRVEEVIDCWFESGAMPYAQQHYPFENTEQFESLFPADYVGEGLDQTRLWFYVLHVLSTVLFDKPAYKQVVVNGMIMAADGQKLSKRLKNYPPLAEVFENEGADSLRFYLLSSTPAVTGDYMRFDRSALKDISRNLFMTLSNSVSFLSMYAEVDGWQPDSLAQPTDLQHPLDLWLVERVHRAVEEVTDGAEKYALAKASWPVYELVDDISNWYIRRSRRRFWKSEDDSDKLQAYACLHWALITTCQLLAPWAPFASEHFYRHLSADIKGAPESVHLCDWPTAAAAKESILAAMVVLREVINEGLAARASAGIKVRQPLGEVVIHSPHMFEKELETIVAEELNVKNVVVKKSTDTKVVLNTEITQELKNEGLSRDLIRNIQQARKEASLEVNDRIDVTVTTDAKELIAAIAQCEDTIKNEVLATTFTLIEQSVDANSALAIEGKAFSIALSKAESK